MTHWSDWFRGANHLMTFKPISATAQMQMYPERTFSSVNQTPVAICCMCTFFWEQNQCQQELYIVSVWHLPHQINSINRLEQVELQCFVSLSQRDLDVVMATQCESTKEVTDNIDMTNLFFLFLSPVPSSSLPFSLYLWPICLNSLCRILPPKPPHSPYPLWLYFSCFLTPCIPSSSSGR